MHFDLTSHESIIAILFLALTILFALAAYFDHRWKKAAPRRSLGFNQKHYWPSESDDTDGENSTSNLYMSYADLSASCLGTAEQHVTLRKTQQNREEDRSETQALIVGDLGDPALNPHVGRDRSSGIPLSH